MKRLLILCLLAVVAFGNAEQARADAFAFGASGLDDEKTLIENLQGLLPDGSGRSFMALNPETVLDMGTAYVALIGLSQDVAGSSRDDSLLITGAGGSELSAYGAYHSSVAAVLSQVVVSWELVSAPGTIGAVSLSDLVTGAYAGASVSGAYYYGTELVYQPDGVSPVTLPGGTIFIGLNLGYGNEVDAIIAFSASPVSSVPLPAAVWLLGSGLAGMTFLRRRAS